MSLTEVLTALRAWNQGIFFGLERCKQLLQRKWEAKDLHVKELSELRPLFTSIIFQGKSLQVPSNLCRFLPVLQKSHI